MKVILIMFSMIFSQCIIGLKDNTLYSPPLITTVNDINNNNYNNYKRFNNDDYDKIEKLRVLNNYSYLEAINYYYTLNFSKPIFPSSNLVLVNKFFQSDQIDETKLVNIDSYKAMYPSILKTTKDNILINKTVLESFINMMSELRIDYPILNNIYIFSGYRDFKYQEIIYNNSDNKSYVAKSKYSEHHTALAIDISTLYYGLTSYFEDSEEFKIISTNCYKYGFILRYMKDKTDITGYSYEPWHLRYVGTIHSTYIFQNNLSLEEYLFQNFEL